MIFFSHLARSRCSAGGSVNHASHDTRGQLTRIHGRLGCVKDRKRLQERSPASHRGRIGRVGVENEQPEQRTAEETCRMLTFITALSREIKSRSSLTFRGCTDLPSTIRYTFSFHFPFLAFAFEWRVKTLVDRLPSL